MPQFPSAPKSNVLIRSSAGTGAVYSFDPVGSYEREACRAAGAAQSLVQPFLDNQVSANERTGPLHEPLCSPGNQTLLYWSSAAFGFCSHQTDLSLQIYFKNQTPAPGTSFPKHLPLPTVLSLVIDSFTGATERHIEVCLF